MTAEQHELLEKTMQEDPSFRARSRAHSLLLSAAGMTIQAIAKTSQVHRVPVSAWIKPWEHHGVQSLHAQPRSGRPSKLTPDEQALAQHSIKEEPRSLKAVVERFAHTTAKRLSLSTLKRLANTAAMEAGEKVAQEAPRARRLCPMSTGPCRLANTRSPRPERALLL